MKGVRHHGNCRVTRPGKEVLSAPELWLVNEESARFSTWVSPECLIFLPVKWRKIIPNPNSSWAWINKYIWPSRDFLLKEKAWPHLRPTTYKRNTGLGTHPNFPRRNEESVEKELKQTTKKKGEGGGNNKESSLNEPFSISEPSSQRPKSRTI